MLEQKTTTNEEFEALCAALLPKFNEYLMRHSKNIFSCELATSLEGIKTMPALYDLNGVQKQVIAPLSLLTQDVDAEIAASKKATKEATTAAAKANDAAASVTKATTDLTVERKKVEDAVSASKMATEAAKNATSDTLASKKAIEQNEATRQSAETARAKAETGRVKAESARVEVEKKRVTAENARATAETERANSETTRNGNESTRKNQETTRQKQEAARVEAEKKRVSAENGRATAENGRVKAETKRETDTRAAITSCKTQTDLAQELNDHPQKQGDNGNWWEWNTTTKQYEDTGVIARGGMMYPTFEILDNELYVTDAGSNIEERIALEDNELILKL
jgi:hypothetical protein